MPGTVQDNYALDRAFALIEGQPALFNFVIQAESKDLCVFLGS